jgi:hypothetical protein
MLTRGLRETERFSQQKILEYSHDVEQGLPSCQLYHLERDPGETTNLIHSEPEMAKEMTQLLHRCVAQGRSTPGGTAANHHGGPSLENWDQINWLPEIPEQYILDD